MSDLEARRQKLLAALQSASSDPQALIRTSQTAIERAKASFGLPSKATAVLAQVQRDQNQLRQKGQISTPLRPVEWKLEALTISRKALLPVLLVGFFLKWWTWVAFLWLPLGWAILKRARGWLNHRPPAQAPEWQLAAELDAWQSRTLNALDGESRVWVKQISQRLVGLLTHWEAIQAWQPEHAFSMESSIRRYLPDAVTPLLMIPAERRALPLPGRSDSPQSLLHEQLAAIDGHLSHIEAQWTAHRGTDLLIHKRFLENRHSPDHRSSD